MFRQHQLRDFELHLRPAPRPIPHVPPIDFIKKHIRHSLNDANILESIHDWVDNNGTIREVRVTTAAIALIHTKWQIAYAQNKSGRFIPPKICLKCFTYGLSGKDGKWFVDVEIHPGVDSWEEGP